MVVKLVDGFFPKNDGKCGKMMAICGKSVANVAL